MAAIQNLQPLLDRSSSFNATTSDIQFGTTPTQVLTVQTIIALVYAAGAGEGNNGYIISRTPSASGNGLRLLVTDNTSQPFATFGGNSTGSPGSPQRSGNANTFPYNAWVHLAGTWDGGLTAAGGVKIFQGVDGAAMSEVGYQSATNGTTAADGNASDNLHIGNREGGDRTWNAYIAYIARWSRVLTLEELIEVQRRGPQAVPDGLVFLWANDEDKGPFKIVPFSHTAVDVGPVPPFNPLQPIESYLHFTSAGNVGVDVTGVSATGAVGDVQFPDISVSVSGVSATGAVGTATATGNQPFQVNTVGGWSWFSNPRAVYHDGHVYAGWVDGPNPGDVGVTKYNNSTGATSSFTLKAAFSDDHANPGLVVTADGKLAAFYAAPSDTVVRYRVTTNALPDISAWGSELTLSPPGTPMSYANPVYLSAASRYFVFSRYYVGGGTGRRGWFRSSSDLSAWSSAQEYFKKTDTDRPYIIHRSNGVDRIDFIVTNTSPFDGPSSVFHFYAKWDSGTSALKWYKTDGTEITTALPFTTADATLVYDGATTRAWLWDVMLDTDGRPRVLFDTFPNENNDHRYNFSRWNGTGWTTPVEVAAAGGPIAGGESVWYSGGICFDGNNYNIVYLTKEVAPAWELQQYVSNDNGATWAKTSDITSGSGSGVKHYRPVSPDNYASGLGLVWPRGTYTSYTDWNADLAGLVLTATEPDVVISATGVAATGAVGDIAINLSIAIDAIGVAATGGVGNVTVFDDSDDATVNVTGLSASGVVGDVAVAAGGVVPPGFPNSPSRIGLPISNPARLGP